MESVPCSTEYDDNYVARNPSIAELDTSPHMSGKSYSPPVVPYVVIPVGNMIPREHGVSVILGVCRAQQRSTDGIGVQYTSVHYPFR